MSNEITIAQQEKTAALAPVIMCDLDPRSIETKKVVYNALNSAESLEEYRIANGLDTITLNGLIIQQRESVDEVTGEITNVEGVIFMTDDGAFYSQSQGLVKSAKNLIGALEGRYPEGEKITIQFKERQLDAKRTWKEFIWC